MPKCLIVAEFVVLLPKKDGASAKFYAQNETFGIFQKQNGKPTFEFELT